MAELSILFGRARNASDAGAEDRFELEALAAEELGIESFAIPLDPVVEGEPERALPRLPRPRSRRWLYRGWMLSEQEYTALFEALADRDEQLVVDPESFAVARTARPAGFVSRDPAYPLTRPAEFRNLFWNASSGRVSADSRARATRNPSKFVDSAAGGGACVRRQTTVRSLLKGHPWAVRLQGGALPPRAGAACCVRMANWGRSQRGALVAAKR